MYPESVCVCMRACVCQLRRVHNSNTFTGRAGRAVAGVCVVWCGVVLMVVFVVVVVVGFEVTVGKR